MTPPAKQRLIVLTDIEADPDDTQSLIRLLLYSNEIDIRGLIATTSTFLKDRVEPGSIRRIIGEYAKVQPNLLLHESGFPAAGDLLRTVSAGLPLYGLQAVGAGKDSSGSEAIVKELRRPDERPLWVSAWGGTATLAQALWTIRTASQPEEAARLYGKLRVYAISDQDDTGAWIRREFPSIFYICSPGPDFRNATWTGITGYFAGADNAVITPDWLAKNIQQGHGPLGAAYPDVAYGMEGDTPSWLALIPNGLGDPEHPDYGGWGGRYELYQPAFNNDPQWKPAGQNSVRPEPETRPLWTNAKDTYSKPTPRGAGPQQPAAAVTSDQATLWRWREDFQNDFAARMAWTTATYAEANHPPLPALATSGELTVHGGQSFLLDATGTTDPDGDSLTYLWFLYPEAGTYKAKFCFAPFSPNLVKLPVTAPEVTTPATLHFILKVIDKGTPPLSRYGRVIVHVLP